MVCHFSFAASPKDTIIQNLDQFNFKIQVFKTFFLFSLYLAHLYRHFSCSFRTFWWASSLHDGCLLFSMWFISLHLSDGGAIDLFHMFLFLADISMWEKMISNWKFNWNELIPRRYNLSRVWSHHHFTSIHSYSWNQIPDFHQTNIEWNLGLTWKFLDYTHNAPKLNLWCHSYK